MSNYDNDNYNTRRRKIYAQRIIEGLCGRCGHPREDLKYNRCNACRAVNRDYSANAYKRQIFVTLTHEHLKWIKDEIKRTGKPKAHIIIDALNFYINNRPSQ
jgi:hypothetical protein